MPPVIALHILILGAGMLAVGLTFLWYLVSGRFPNQAPPTAIQFVAGYVAVALTLVFPVGLLFVRWFTPKDLAFLKWKMTNAMADKADRTPWKDPEVRSAS